MTGALTTEEEECGAHFRTTHSRDSSRRYIVRIPLKSSISQLGDSLYTAQRCLQQTLRRLTRDNEYQDRYKCFMTEYKDLGHMMRAPTKNHAVKVHYYLPHHGVLRSDSSTTKVHVVFNGSNATTTRHSVNDFTRTGAKLQLNILDVFIWIRHHRHVFVTDITKMFKQIKVHPGDWDLQWILWVNDQLNPVPYQLSTVTYGTKVAPFLAVRTRLQLTDDEGHRFPLAVSALKSGRYVNDIFGVVDSVDQLIEIAQQLKHLGVAGGFPLAKLRSNQSELLKAISSASTSTTTISLDNCETKILGINWTPHEDRFIFSSNFHQSSELSESLTKRLILSEMVQIFDPLGFISPVTVRAKMLLQELCKLNGDEPLPSQIASRWLILREDLSKLASIFLPRWINTWSNSIIVIHGFSDASQLAMSADIYVTVHSSSTEARAFLLCSKTKVTPLKKLTIPRLELTAALLLSTQIKYVRATLKLDVNETHLWTDSQVTLMWIRSHVSHWKDYVSNKVIQIQELTPQAHWWHVPGISNPADCTSSGVSTAELMEHSLWWTEPP